MVKVFPSSYASLTTVVGINHGLKITENITCGGVIFEHIFRLCTCSKIPPP